MRSRRSVAFLAAAILWAIFAAASPEHAFAHATLKNSDPPANEVVSQSPGRVSLTFSEAIEQTYTKVILVDQDNKPVSGTKLEFDATDDTIARLDIPTDLPRGTYSVVWRTLSAADGHRFSGYFAFTIGSSSDVRTVIPPQFTDAGGAPFWLSAASRWISFVTLALLAGLWFAWLVIIRPALRPVWQIGPDVTRRVRRYAMLAGLAYVVATLVALVVQSRGATDAGLLHSISTTVTDTRWGRFWVLRIIFGALVTLIIPIAAWWWPRHRLWTAIPLLALSALLPLPHAMVSHASAQQYGRTSAIAVDYFHLTAMSLWFGGLGVLLVSVSAAGDLLPGGRRLFLGGALPRFSWMALIAFTAIGLTGFYSGYLQIGTWHALTDTPYGRQLLYKLMTLAVVLIIASVNLMLVSRRAAGMSDHQITRWWRRFIGLVALEIAGAVVILFFAGRLTAMEPSRSVLAQESNQKDITFQLKDRTATLSLAPGTAGTNHIVLNIHGDTLDSSVTAALLFVPPVDLAGDKNVPLDRTTGNSFEAHSAAMSQVGDWQITVTVAQVGAFQWSTTIPFTAGPAAANVSTIGYPSWVLNTSAILGFLLGIAGLVGIGWGLRSSSRSARREGLGLGAAAVLVAAVLIIQGRNTVASAGIPLNTANPVPVTDQAIEVGKTEFMANCAACHGVDASGNGPAGLNLDPPPANLLVGHALYHYDAEFFNWIRNGKPGTAMPAFSSSMTDEEIWSTILYVRSLQQQAAQGTPAASPVASPVVSPTPNP